MHKKFIKFCYRMKMTAILKLPFCNFVYIFVAAGELHSYAALIIKIKKTTGQVALALVLMKGRKSLEISESFTSSDSFSSYSAFKVRKKNISNIYNGWSVNNWQRWQKVSRKLCRFAFIFIFWLTYKIANFFCTQHHRWHCLFFWHMQRTQQMHKAACWCHSAPNQTIPKTKQSKSSKTHWIIWPNFSFLG